MARTKATSPSTATRKPRPALTPEARENQLISLAIDRAEQQLIDGTASSQVIVHYLRLGTEKAKLEIERLKEENKLLIAKTEALESAKESKLMYEEALRAMRRYSGQREEYEESDY